MKKLWGWLAFVAVALVVGIGLFQSAVPVYAAGGMEQDGRTVANKASQQVSVQASNTIPVPVVQYFQERRTIARWATHWDKPNLPCYVYLLSYGQIIGYFVSDGKPAATTSYLTPGAIDEYMGNGGTKTHEMPDIDGCYGENNAGIRFFTATGAAIEASGFQYIYSDVKLDLNVPEIRFSR